MNRHKSVSVVSTIAAVAATAFLTGCSHSAAAKSVTEQVHSPVAAPQAAGKVPIGPGPSGTYTVAAQPAPGTCHFRYTAGGQPLPDPVCTPGATNPKVTPETVADTICHSGYTSSIRPPASITDREKDANAKSYGYTANLHDAEYDHLISLELGGDPNDPRNIWVEPPSPGHQSGSGPENPKDKVENQLHALVCGKKVPLGDAQSAIATDWTTALATVGHPDGK